VDLAEALPIGPILSFLAPVALQDGEVYMLDGLFQHRLKAII
jgi:hypothetical protein